MAKSHKCGQIWSRLDRLDQYTYRTKTVYYWSAQLLKLGGRLNYPWNYFQTASSTTHAPVDTPTALQADSRHVSYGRWPACQSDVLQTNLQSRGWSEFFLRIQRLLCFYYDIISPWRFLPPRLLQRPSQRFRSETRSGGLWQQVEKVQQGISTRPYFILVLLLSSKLFAK